MALPRANSKTGTGKTLQPNYPLIHHRGLRGGQTAQVEVSVKEGRLGASVTLSDSPGQRRQRRWPSAFLAVPVQQPQKAVWPCRARCSCPGLFWAARGWSRAGHGAWKWRGAEVRLRAGPPTARVRATPWLQRRAWRLIYLFIYAHARMRGHDNHHGNHRHAHVRPAIEGGDPAASLRGWSFHAMYLPGLSARALLFGLDVGVWALQLPSPVDV